VRLSQLLIRMIQKLRAFHWSNNVHSTHCSILFHCTLHIYSIKFTQLLSVSSIAARVVKLSGVPSRHGLTRPTLAHWRWSTVSAHHVGRNAGLDDEPWPYPRPIAFPVLMRQCLSQNMVISLHKHKCHIDHKDIRNVKFLCLIDSRRYHLCVQSSTAHYTFQSATCAAIPASDEQAP
jgi:hypothetical protein